MKALHLISALTIMACLALSGAALAAQKGGGFTGPGGSGNSTMGSGFTGPGTPLITVEQAKTMSDDSRVTLRGHIESSIDGKHYMFKDSTGSIRVEIDRKRWNGQSVSPTDLIEIQGEVDKDWNSVEIDVKRLIKLPATQ